MNANPSPVPSQRELEVEAEGREWMRRRLEETLQVQAGRHGGTRRCPGSAGRGGRRCGGNGIILRHKRAGWTTKRWRGEAGR